MGYAKNMLGVLVLCLAAALGLMAVSASGAQAQAGWLVNGAFINSTRTVDGTIHPLKATAPTERHMLLSGTALGGKVKILCEELTVDDGLLFANEKAEGLAIFLFSTCPVLLNEIVVHVCEILQPITMHVKFHAILHNSLTYLLFEPGTTGQPFVKIKFPNEECPLFPERELAGSWVVQCLSEALKTMEEATGKPDLCLSDLVHHLISEAPNQKLFGSDGLTFASNAAKLEGILDLLMSGADSGKTWAVHI